MVPRKTSDRAHPPKGERRGGIQSKRKLAMFKVRSKYLLLIAAAVWLIAGSQVARMGIEAIAAGNGNLWLLLIGIPATFVVFHMMFSKLVGKHAARIRSYGEEKMHVLKFFGCAGLPPSWPS